MKSAFTTAILLLLFTACDSAKPADDELATAIAKLPSDGKPTAGATLRVLLRESPVAWASFERAL